MINRSVLDTFRSSSGMGQHNIRNQGQRSNDMAFNSFPQYQPFNKAGALPSAAGDFGVSHTLGGTTATVSPVVPQWNPYAFNGVVGGTSPSQPTNAPAGFTPNTLTTPTASASAPIRPQFAMNDPNNPTVNLNGMDSARRFVGRPSLTPQQMRMLQRRQPVAPMFGGGLGDGFGPYIEPPFAG